MSDDDQAARFVDTDLGQMGWGDCMCNQCVHVHEDGVHCEAFPDGIPSEILAGRVTLYTPHPGDGGIRFEPRPTAPGA